MKIIYTKKQEEIFVDDCDYEMLCKYTWYLDRYGYATTTIKQNGKWKNYRMHRMIMNISDPKVLVDHIDGNKIDNRRSNLRGCNHSENLRNRGANKNSQSGVKGLRYNKHKNQWQARIMLNNKKYSKAFACKKYGEELAKDKAIQWLKENRGKLHGEFTKH